MAPEARFLDLENTKRMLKDKWERNSKVLKLEGVKEERQEHMEMCAATHLRLGPIPRPIARRIFCSGMWRPGQGSSPSWLNWGYLGPARWPGRGYYGPERDLALVQGCSVTCGGQPSPPHSDAPTGVQS